MTCMRAALASGPVSGELAVDHYDRTYGPGVRMPCACFRGLAPGAGGVVAFVVWLGVGLG